MGANLLTTTEAGALCRVTPGTIRAWVASGRLPCVRPGHRLLVPVEAVRSLLENRGGTDHEKPHQKPA